MNITSTILTKMAVETTSNANYNIEYTIIDEKLNRVQVSIESLAAGENIERPYLGNIYWEHSNLSCNLPVEDSCVTAPYFSDFDMIMNKIKENMIAEAAG